MLLTYGPSFQNVLLDAARSVDQELQKNDCNSPGLLQFEDNFARAILGQKSLQADGRVTSQFQDSCVQKNLFGLTSEFPTSISEACSCLDKAIQDSQVPRRHKAKLENILSRFNFLGVLASDPGN